MIAYGTDNETGMVVTLKVDAEGRVILSPKSIEEIIQKLREEMNND